jgi:hypothetical protein
MIRWPRLKREWRGLRVKSRRSFETGVLVIPAGSIGTVTDGGPIMRVTFDRCQCCGVQAKVARIASADFELIGES